MTKKGIKKVVKKTKKIGWYEDDGGVRNGLPEPIIDRFIREIRKVQARLFLQDEDGDYPVVIEVYDRTKTGPCQYNALPHLHKSTDEEVMEALRLASGNVRQAGDEVRQVAYEIQNRALDKARLLDEARRPKS